MWAEATRRAVALAGSSIDERLVLDAPAPGVVDDALAERRWREWCESATATDARAFARALAGEGIDPAVARCALGREAYPPSRPLPAWLADICWLIEAACGATTLPVAGDQEPVAFEPVFRPMADAMLRHLERSAGDIGDGWLPSARMMLGHAFTANLAGLCGPAMLAAFTDGRAPATDDTAAGPISTSAYEAFVGDLAAGALWSFFRDRPVLARLAAEQAAGAVAAAADVLQRFHADRLELERRLAGGKTLGPIATIELGLSDRHHHGRTVVVLGMSDGYTLVYKPRDCAIDHAWAGLLAWLARHAPGVDLHAPRIVRSPGYGWVEFVDTAPCLDGAEVARFYHRYGLLLAITTLLQSRDMHQDNVIAHGEYPVLVDLEMLLCPDLGDLDKPDRRAGPARALREARQRLARSVTRTLMLPTAAAASADRFFAIGALSQGAPETYTTFAWMDLNTDRMRRVRRAVVRPGTRALAERDGRTTIPGEHVAEILDGFVTAARAVIAHRDALMAPAGPLAAFAGASIRIVVRPTHFYLLLMRRAAAIANLGDGVAWSRHLYFLWRQEPERAFSWRVMRTERTCLARGDVPRFVTGADGTWLDLGDGERLDGVFERSALTEARTAIASLDEREIDRQLDRIRAAFGVSAGTTVTSRAADRRGQVVQSVAALIAAEAIEADGGAAWLVRQPVISHATVSETDVAGPDLYNGATGIALFLGALYAVGEDSRWRRLALAAMAPVRQDIAEGPASFVDGLGIGGVGWLIHGLARLGAFLGDVELVADACRLASAIDDAAIARDRHYDVMGGAAGLILALLPLARQAGEPALLRLATLAGHHLLDTRTTAGNGRRVWASGRFPPLTGFSHGAAGIACALARLTRVTGDARFLAAAREAIDFERACYSDTEANWPDYRQLPSGGRTEYRCQWCHGAAGIALARVASRPAIDDPAIDDEIRSAVSTTLAYAGDAADHYCCGELGRIETLFTVGRAWNDAALLAAADRRLDALLDRAEARGRYRWAQGSDVENLGLFQGLAGLGYQLLRMRHPERVPSILVWE